MLGPVTHKLVELIDFSVTVKCDSSVKHATWYSCFFLISPPFTWIKQESCGETFCYNPINLDEILDREDFSFCQCLESNVYQPWCEMTLEGIWQQEVASADIARSANPKSIKCNFGKTWKVWFYICHHANILFLWCLLAPPIYQQS